MNISKYIKTLLGGLVVMTAMASCEDMMGDFLDKP